MIIGAGDRLQEACALAQREVVLVAPYMKSGVVERLFEVIPIHVATIRCITRWKPEEVAQGVSDLEVLDVVENRPGASLRLHPYLHAKYYRVDNQCLVGSANLTLSALSWKSPANVELLVLLDEECEDLAGFESRLMEESVVANRDLQSLVAKAAAAIPSGQFDYDGIQSAVISLIAAAGWLPRSIDLSVIYRVYSKGDLSDALESSIQAAYYDLSALAIPRGLPENEFWINLRAGFSLMPLVNKIDGLAKEGLTDVQGVALLADSAGIDEIHGYDAPTHWQIMKYWMTNLYPGSYRDREASVQFIKGRVFDPKD